jgi:hypothetical protein
MFQRWQVIVGSAILLPALVQCGTDPAGQNSADGTDRSGGVSMAGSTEVISPMTSSPPASVPTGPAALAPANPGAAGGNVAGQHAGPMAAPSHGPALPTPSASNPNSPAAGAGSVCWAMWTVDRSALELVKPTADRAAKSAAADASYETAIANFVGALSTARDHLDGGQNGQMTSGAGQFKNAFLERIPLLLADIGHSAEASSAGRAQAAWAAYSKRLSYTTFPGFHEMENVVGTDGCIEP